MTEEQTQPASEEETPALPTPNFQLLATQFATQAMMEMGDIENPMTGQSEVSLVRAKFTIEMLQILRDKTEGNLSPEELQFLESVLYQVRMRFMELKKEAG